MKKRKSKAQKRQYKLKQMDIASQAHSTTLTGKEHASSESDKVSVMKNEFMNIKL